MRIVIIISNPELGGAQRVAINLMEWLNEQEGTNVSIVALSHREDYAYDMSNYDYTALKTKSKIWELRKLIIKQRFDIVLTMGVPLSIYTVPATIGLPLKHVVSERNDPAHFAGKKTTAVVSRLLMKCADGYVFQTKDAQNFYGSNVASHSVIIPNPLYNLNKMPSYPFNGEREKTIVTVGRLNPQKNQAMLIDAFSSISDRFPDYMLEIWGDGDEKSKLEKQIYELGMSDRISLCGTSKDIFNCIYKSSLFILSSNFEGMPNALIEAMALGLPVISTDCPCGGPSFLIRNKKNGILIPINGKNELSASMITLLSDKEKANSLGCEAFKIRKELSVDDINKKWYKYFETLTK